MIFSKKQERKLDNIRESVSSVINRISSMEWEVKKSTRDQEIIDRLREQNDQLKRGYSDMVDRMNHQIRDIYDQKDKELSKAWSLVEQYQEILKGHKIDVIEVQR